MTSLLHVLAAVALLLSLFAGLLQAQCTSPTAQLLVRNVTATCTSAWGYC